MVNRDSRDQKGSNTNAVPHVPPDLNLSVPEVRGIARDYFVSAQARHMGVIGVCLAMDIVTKEEAKENIDLVRLAINRGSDADLKNLKESSYSLVLKLMHTQVDFKNDPVHRGQMHKAGVSTDLGPKATDELLSMPHILQAALRAANELDPSKDSRLLAIARNIEASSYYEGMSYRYLPKGNKPSSEDRHNIKSILMDVLTILNPESKPGDFPRDDLMSLCVNEFKDLTDSQLLVAFAFNRVVKTLAREIEVAQTSPDHLSLAPDSWLYPD